MFSVRDGVAGTARQLHLAVMISRLRLEDTPLRIAWACALGLSWLEGGDLARFADLPRPTKPLAPHALDGVLALAKQRVRQLTITTTADRMVGVRDHAGVRTAQEEKELVTLTRLVDFFSAVQGGTPAEAGKAFRFFLSRAASSFDQVWDCAEVLVSIGVVSIGGT